jgi:hypothetical protein
MYLKTWAESTLTISTGKWRAISSATPLLPVAVGPIRKIAGGKAASDLSSFTLCSVTGKWGEDVHILDSTASANRYFFENSGCKEMLREKSLNAIFD